MPRVRQPSRALNPVYSYPYDVAAMCAMNPRFYSIFQSINDLKLRYPHMSAEQMVQEVMTLHPELDTDAVVDGGFPLCFEEAVALDDYFFETGKNEFWRQAYGFPLKNKQFTPNCYAVSVGMFTFSMNHVPE